VPEQISEHELEQLLKYSDSPKPDNFVADVMQQVRHQKRTRRLVLFIFGFIGALFGVAGAVMLSDTISRVFTFTVPLPATETMQVVLFIVAALAFHTWIMNDDMSLSN